MKLVANGIVSMEWKVLQYAAIKCAVQQNHPSVGLDNWHPSTHGCHDIRIVLHLPYPVISLWKPWWTPVYRVHPWPDQEAQWLVRLALDQAIQAQALLSFQSASLNPDVQMGIGELILGVNLRTWTCIPSRGEYNIRSRFMLRRPG